MPLNFNQKVKLFHTSLLIIFCCLMFCSCHDKVPNSNFQLSLDEFKNSRSSAYAINSKVIRNTKIQIWLNIIVTIILFYLSYLAFVQNYEIVKTRFFGHDTQMLYNKMQYLHIIAIVNAVYTCYIIFKLKNAHNDTK